MEDLQLEILEKLKIGVVITDLQGNIEFSNSAAREIFRKLNPEVDSLSRDLSDFCPMSFVDSGGNELTAEIKLPFSNGTVELLKTRLDIGKQLIQMRDISEEIRLREEISSSNIIDTESGLIKRNYIYDTLQREMSRARRFGRNVGLIMVRISDLAQPGVNTAPKIVARTLRGIGEILGNDLRAYDLAFKYDKDIFAVILPGESLDGAMCVANRLYAKFVKLGIQRTRIGVANMGSATSPESVIESAMRALYVAEHSDNPIATI